MLLFPFVLMAVEGEGGGSDSGDQDGDNGGDSGNGSQESQDDSGNQGGEAGDGDGDGDSGSRVEDLPDWAQKEIKSLRSESAKHRTTNKDLSERFGKLESGLKSALGLEDDSDLSDEEKIGGLQATLEQAEVQNAILGLAIENGIGMEDLEYFSFKMQNALEGLEEDAELSEDDFASIVQGVKGRGQSPADSSVKEKNGGKGPDGGSGISVDAFVNMNMMERNQLYKEKPEVYKSLFAQANAKGLLN